MNHTTHNNSANFICGIDDDVLRDVYSRGIKVPEIADQKLLTLDGKAAKLDETIEEAMGAEE